MKKKTSTSKSSKSKKVVKHKISKKKSLLNKSIKSSKILKNPMINIDPEGDRTLNFEELISHLDKSIRKILHLIIDLYSESTGYQANDIYISGMIRIIKEAIDNGYIYERGWEPQKYELSKNEISKLNNFILELENIPDNWAYEISIPIHLSNRNDYRN